MRIFKSYIAFMVFLVLLDFRLIIFERHIWRHMFDIYCIVYTPREAAPRAFFPPRPLPLPLPFLLPLPELCYDPEFPLGRTKDTSCIRQVT